MVMWLRIGIVELSPYECCRCVILAEFIKKKHQYFVKVADWTRNMGVWVFFIVYSHANYPERSDISIVNGNQLTMLVPILENWWIINEMMGCDEKLHSIEIAVEVYFELNYSLTFECQNRIPKACKLHTANWKRHRHTCQIFYANRVFIIIWFAPRKKLCIRFSFY